MSVIEEVEIAEPSPLTSVRLRVESGVGEDEAIADVLRSLNEETLRLLAYSYLSREWRRERRSFERSTEQAERQRHQRLQGHLLQAAKSNGFDSYDEYEVHRQKLDNDAAEASCRAKDEIMARRNIAVAARQAAVEFTAQFVSTHFALPSGKRVTWGAATVEQHALRVDMLSKQIRATSEDVDLHRRVISLLKDVGVDTLNLARVQ